MTTTPATSETIEAADGPTIRVRGQDFTESVTIAEVYGQYLEAKGYDVEILTAAGFRTEAIDGINNGDLDLIVDYIGGCARPSCAPDEGTSSDPDEVVDDHRAAVRGDRRDAARLLAGRRRRRARRPRRRSTAETISDLAGASARLRRLGAVLRACRSASSATPIPTIYGIEFADTTTIEFGPLLGEALAADEVDAVVWNTTAPQIDEKGFKVLEDDKGLHPAQNIAPIVVNSRCSTPTATSSPTDLNDLSAAITTDDLLAWNIETDIEFRESDEVATEWLTAEGLI